VFQPIKRAGKEWGTAVVTRKSGDGRLRVYTARYMLVIRGKERGQSKIEVEEVALSTAEVLAKVMQATVDRGGDTEPPTELGPRFGTREKECRLIDSRMFIPTKAFLTKGVGRHKEKLTSFEMALRDAHLPTSISCA